MIKKANFSQIISFIFHPLMMPTILFSIIFYGIPILIPDLNKYASETQIGIFSLKAALIILIFMKTYLLPAIIIYILYRLRIIKRLEMETIAERRIPYLVTVIIYTLVAIFFSKKLSQLPEIAVIFIFITISICIVAVVSVYWKISAHAVGISGLVGILMGAFIRLNLNYILIYVFISLLFSILILIARLKLKAHNLAQVLVGFGVGFIVSLVCVLFYIGN
ncbi:MAG: hypothetical protein KA327_01000 [Pseudarcicella sp.]|nr:hypothetical protein [Pseudarcicella sp.]